MEYRKNFNLYERKFIDNLVPLEDDGFKSSVTNFRVMTSDKNWLQYDLHEFYMWHQSDNMIYTVLKFFYWTYEDSRLFLYHAMIFTVLNFFELLKIHELFLETRWFSSSIFSANFYLLIK